MALLEGWTHLALEDKSHKTEKVDHVIETAAQTAKDKARQLPSCDTQTSAQRQAAGQADPVAVSCQRAVGSGPKVELVKLKSKSKRRSFHS